MDETDVELIDVPACPIDGASGEIFLSDVRDAFFGTPGRWTYRRHARSGHLWLDPRPDGSSIGALYARYYTHDAEQAAPSSGVWQQAMRLAQSTRLGYPPPDKAGVSAWILTRLPSVSAAAELEMMRLHASESGRLLDVGCGDGSFLRRMRDAGWDVTGTEPDALAAARLAEREGFPVRASVDELLSAGTQRFDVIVLSHVIEHLPDPVSMLAQLRRMLEPSGRLILTTPNAQGLGTRIFGSSWRGLEPPRHFNVFTPASLRLALDRAGFRVARLRTEVRLARGIWFLSWLARAGGRELEIGRRSAHPILKFAGYAFQILEAGVIQLKPELGEEIFCVAVAGEGRADD